MIVPIYLKTRQRRAFPKYHRIQDKISSRYDLIRQNFFSSFHNWSKIDEEEIDKSTLEFLSKYDFPLSDLKDVEKIQSFNDSVQVFQSKFEENSYNEVLNWSRGRILGHVVSIIVDEGLIIEKIYLTCTGKKISVKRKELGVLSRYKSLLNILSINLQEYFANNN